MRASLVDPGNLLELAGVAIGGTLALTVSLSLAIAGATRARGERGGSRAAHLALAVIGLAGCAALAALGVRYLVA